MSVIATMAHEISDVPIENVYVTMTQSGVFYRGAHRRSAMVSVTTDTPLENQEQFAAMISYAMQSGLGMPREEIFFVFENGKPMPVIARELNLEPQLP